MGFSYGYGGEFRDPDSPHIDNGILNANGNFDTSEQGEVSGIIDIHVGDLLISGSDGFIEYIPSE